MVSTVQHRREQADAGNGGDEANAAAAGAKREAPFSDADLEAFFARHEVRIAPALWRPTTPAGVRLRAGTHTHWVLCATGGAGGEGSS